MRHRNTICFAHKNEADSSSAVWSPHCQNSRPSGERRQWETGLWGGYGRDIGVGNALGRRCDLPSLRAGRLWPVEKRAIRMPQQKHNTHTKNDRAPIAVRACSRPKPHSNTHVAVAAPRIPVSGQSFCRDPPGMRAILPHKCDRWVAVAARLARGLARTTRRWPGRSGWCTRVAQS